MNDVLTEIRILYHVPLQKHRNLVNILGVAWIMEPEVLFDNDDILEESLDPHQGNKDRPRQEWPAIVIELSPLGNLIEFLKSPKSVAISLRAKLHLCSDVMNAISVSHLTIFFSFYRG